jgi:hypothetical protein
MEQCHSGGFNNAVIAKSTANSTSIASACLEPNNSIGGADFDPFARDWIAAMKGADPYGYALQYNPDTSGNGRVSAREAFDYADAIHDPYDTPVFNAANGGGGCWLGSDIFRFIPPLLMEPIIRRFWPEPDPLLLERRLEVALPQIEALEKEFEPRLQKLQETYQKDLATIMRNAKRI